MQDFNENLKTIKEYIAWDVADLKENGDSDATLNYLYFLRDEVRKQIRKENKAKRKASK